MGARQVGEVGMIFDLLRRKETRITTTAELERYLRAGNESSAGVAVTPESAMRLSAVFSCVRVLAESTGQIPIHLYRKSENRREKAEDHPLFSVIHDAPNEYQTAQEFWEMVAAHLALRGNSYSFINRGASGNQLELLPLNPDAVTVKRRKDRSIVYEVRYDGELVIYRAEEIFHVRGMTLDGLVGVSPISYNREAVGLGLAEEQHAARLFSNGARPGGILSTEQSLGENAVKNIRESWEGRFQGVGNSHKVAILEKGLKWAQIGLSPEDAQMIEQRKYSRTEIAGIFRVPPTMIGDLERATYSNTEQQARSFIDFTLMPYLARIEQRIALQLLTPKERKTYFAKFNTSALLRGDMTARANFYTRQLQNGAMSPNEIRELEDMNPRPDGDVYLTPSNMLIDGKLPEGMGASNAPADPAAGKDAVVIDFAAALERGLTRIAGAMTQGKPESRYSFKRGKDGHLEVDPQ